MWSRGCFHKTLIPNSAKHFRMWKYHWFHLSLPAASYRKVLPCTQEKSLLYFWGQGALSVFFSSHKLSHEVNKKVCWRTPPAFLFSMGKKSLFSPQLFESHKYFICILDYCSVPDPILFKYILDFHFCILSYLPCPVVIKQSLTNSSFLVWLVWCVFLPTAKIIYLFIWFGKW